MKRVTRYGFLASVAILALVAACSDDAAPQKDAAIYRDGAALGDGSAADTLIRSDAIRPDLYAQGTPELGTLTLYVNLGDSIAAGWGVAIGSSYRELLHRNNDTAYPSFAGKDLATRYPGIRAVSTARPGATSDEIISQAQEIDDNLDGDNLVTISVGGNDLLNDYQALLSADKTRELATLVKTNLLAVKNHFADTTLFPGKTTIAIFNVYDPTDGTGGIPLAANVVSICEVLKSIGPLVGETVLSNFAIFNDELRAFAESEGLLLVDMHTAFLGHGFNYDQPQTPYYVPADPSLWFANDCIHPNGDGHGALRALIWDILFDD